MGIRHLNRFFKENASSAIKQQNLSELSGKKIAIDISIYMYKYASDNALIENIYLMLSTFRHYNIIPVFIFDGKPPAEKDDLLRKRREDKKNAENEYNNMKQLLENNANMDDAERREIISNMDVLKKQFIYISKTDIEMIKQLISACGATYYDAVGEADELCVLLTIKGNVWGCLSEDMDMFVYGCPRVFRYLSLLKHTVILYDTKVILKTLGITQKNLSEICILSGTDYNTEADFKNGAHTLYDNLKHFKKYQKDKSTLDFSEWLYNQPNYILDNDALSRINDIFELNNTSSNIKFDKLKISNGAIDKEALDTILKNDGFILPITL